MGITTETVNWGKLDCCCNNKDCVKVESITWSAWFTSNVQITMMNENLYIIGYYNITGNIKVLFTLSDGTTYEQEKNIMPSMINSPTGYQATSQTAHEAIELNAFTVRIDKDEICDEDALWQFNGDSLPLVSPETPNLPKWGSVDMRYEKNDGDEESWTQIG